MITVNNSKIDNIKLASTSINKAYLGNSIIFEKENLLPVKAGLICWLDGKDIKSNTTDWYTSSNLNCVYQNFCVRIRTSGNRLVAGSYMEITGTEGGASSFTAASTKIAENPFHAAGMSTTSSMTIEAVITKITNGNIIIMGGAYYGSSSVGKYRYQFQINAGSLYVSWHNGSSWSNFRGTTTLNKDIPYHVVFQKDGTTVRFYINGTLDEEFEASSYRIPSVENCGLIGFGRYDRLNATTKQTGAGKYYSLAIYNRALSLEEIQTNYNIYFNRYNLIT